MNTSDTKILWHFDTFSTTPRVEFISQKLIKVVAAFNASDLVVLIESQPLDLDLDIQDQNFQMSVDRGLLFLSAEGFGTSIEGF